VKILLLGFTLFGIIMATIFIHEGVHWLQYNEEKKEICFFGKGISYLDTYGDIIYFETEKQHHEKQLEAIIIANGFLIISSIIERR